MGLFDRMANAPVFGRGRWHVPGKFVEQVKAIKVFDSRDPKKNGRTMMACEHEILEFDGTTYTNVKGVSVNTSKEFKTGDTVTHIIDLGNSMYGKGNAKEYMAMIHQAFIVQREGKPCTYSEAMEFMSTPEGEKVAEEYVLGPKSKDVPGLVVKTEAWATAMHAGEDDFTAKRFSAFSDTPST